MKQTILCLLAFFISVLGFSQKSNNNIIAVKEYIITLDITDITGGYIEGYTSLRLSPVQENTNLILLDLQNLSIDSITCNQSEINGYTYNDTLISIELTNSFNPTDEITINVYYHGNPQKDPSGWGGFYFMNGYAFNLGVGFDDIPHNYGRVWFPCNDNFTDRAIYKTIITTQQNHTAVCGGELVQVTENIAEQTKTYEWHINHEVPTYLVSVAVGDYKLQSHTYEGIEANIPVEFYIYPTDSARTANSFVNIDSVMRVFETKYGAYPWNRVGYVSVPFNSGAMEHVSNIAMGRGFIDGTLYYEDLFYHELAHMWFGNFITCSSAEDMWINEGWATYNETVYKEYLYGLDVARRYRNKSHEKVLRYYHIEDGGFHPLYPMDQSLTYSSTVYEKGASTVHSLRGYLGDEMFFNAITQFLQENAYTSVSSYDMRDFLTNYTGIDMTDFFDDWVFSPGFVHFSIDSAIVQQNGAEYDVIVYMQQKLRGRETYANSNRVEVSFMRPNYSVQTELMEFDGQFGMQSFTIPFEPILTLCDYNQVLGDATIDEVKFLKSTGYAHYNYTYFMADVQSVNENDSTFFRVTHNWVAPDAFKTEIPGLIIADHRYWIIEALQTDNFKAKARFSYNTSIYDAGYVDNNFITNSVDSLVLLYRPNKAADWTVEPANNSSALKRFTVDSVKSGEYSLAIWDWDLFTDISNQKIIKNLSDVYPNPNTGEFYLKTEENYSGTAQILNNIGVIIYQKNIQNTDTDIRFELSNLPDGLYFIKLINDKTNRVITRKIIVQK